MLAMHTRLAIGRTALALCAMLVWTGCGSDDDGSGAVNREVVPYLNAGFVGEAGAVRIGWLPARRASRGYEILRTEGLDMATDITTVEADLRPIAAVTGTSHDDLTADLGRLYGYAVQVSGSVEVSRVVWVELHTELVGIRVPAGTLEDACLGTTEQTAYMAVIPGDASRGFPGTASGPVDIQLFAAESGILRVDWGHTRPGAETVYAGSVTRGVPRGCNRVDVLLPGLAVDEEAYARRIRATFDGHPAWVDLPRDQAAERVRMGNLDPPAGRILRPGFQRFSARVAYAVQDTETRLLSLLAFGRDETGTRRLIGSLPVPLSAAAGEVDVSLDVMVDPRWASVDLSARFAIGTPDTFLIEDLVSYAVLR